MRYLGLVSLLFSGLVHAQTLNTEELCARMELNVEAFAFGVNGKLLEKKKETQRVSSNKSWSSNGGKQCIIETGWTSVWNEQDAPLALRFSLEAKANNVLELNVKQYETNARYDSSEKPILEKTFRVDSMQSIMWESPLHKIPQLMVRFTPNISIRERPSDLDKLNIAAKEMIVTDQNGSVWMEDMSINGRYITIRTYKGSVALSYYPFPGAKVIGEASNKTMTLESPEGLRLKLRSQTPFLAQGLTANVYGLFSSKKTLKPGSINSGATDKLEKFMKNLQDF